MPRQIGSSDAILRQTNLPASRQTNNHFFYSTPVWPSGPVNSQTGKKARKRKKDKIHSTLTTIIIITISFFASLVRSTLGFGESLIAVPLFLLFLPLTIAVPLSVLLSVVIALVIVIQDHKKIHFQSAKWLVIYAIAGIPVGLFILIYGNETFVKIALGLLIIAYSLYSLFKKKTDPNTQQQNNKLWLFVCGFLSGVFGGAYGLNGPPLVVYGNLRNWTAKYFRATLQAYFLPASIIGAIGYYAKGLITTEVNHYFLYSLTTAIPAIFLGRYLNSKLNDHSFFKYVYGSLVIIGLILIGNSLK